MPLLLLFLVLSSLGGVLVGSHVCVFRHGVRHLRNAMQSQSVRKLRFHIFELTNKYIFNLTTQVYISNT